MAVSVSDASARSTGRLRKSPSVTSVPGDATMSPAHCRPTAAINSPMPAAIACFNDVGIAVISRSRSPMPAVTMNTMPATATAPSATRHGTFMAMTTE